MKFHSILDDNRITKLFKLPNDVCYQLEAMARIMNTSQQYVVQQAIREYVENHTNTLEKDVIKSYVENQGR